mmetsp:Transcript_3659/g.9510  ORF Transcript_3659/g.9510 Transcript_3659/m.9510 type:complete len:294 (+) Transcript_3659:241-1122(+)
MDAGLRRVLHPRVGHRCAGRVRRVDRSVAGGVGGRSARARGRPPCVRGGGAQDGLAVGGPEVRGAARCARAGLRGTELPPRRRPAARVPHLDLRPLDLRGAVQGGAAAALAAAGAAAPARRAALEGGGREGVPLRHGLQALPRHRLVPGRHAAVRAVRRRDRRGDRRDVHLRTARRGGTDAGRAGAVAWRRGRGGGRERGGGGRERCGRRGGRHIVRRDPPLERLRAAPAPRGRVRRACRRHVGAHAAEAGACRGELPVLQGGRAQPLPTQGEKRRRRGHLRREAYCQCARAT